MLTFETILPYLLMKLTLIFELIAFLSSHMIDSRNYTTLHEGIFQRCVYPVTQDPYTFKCLWWSADTFNTDRSFLIQVLNFFLVTFFLSFIAISDCSSIYFYVFDWTDFNIWRGKRLHD